MFAVRKWDAVTGNLLNNADEYMDVSANIESAGMSYTPVDGIDGIDMAGSAKTKIYDLNGREVKTMERGLYIVKEGGKARKVMIP